MTAFRAPARPNVTYFILTTFLASEYSFTLKKKLPESGEPKKRGNGTLAYT